MTESRTGGTPRSEKPTGKLETGKVYHNRGGGDYYVPVQIETPGRYLVRNVRTGWTCVANDVTVYEDGTIDWAWSSGGCFR